MLCTGEYLPGARMSDNYNQLIHTTMYVHLLVDVFERCLFIWVAIVSGPEVGRHNIVSTLENGVGGDTVSK